VSLLPPGVKHHELCAEPLLEEVCTDLTKVLLEMASDTSVKKQQGSWILMDPDLLLMDPAQFLTDSSYWGNEQARLLPERKFDPFFTGCCWIGVAPGFGRHTRPGTKLDKTDTRQVI